ncbi:DUF4330 domain-containing protein [Natronolimnobius sp. AArcel1]|uniref:DUF4330 domain-containing protein n=1 Tax=Natronolimnobius sp. AArcel1 TaxID=1679093 RepID=UPI0013EDE8FD|nr:DUF4330 domain-containing protein [Natronolimnobius sp. AArcel1]NGM69109.1 DUF4330 domain-containing protein [Natronolimnobius sp. AArcel1]
MELIDENGNLLGVVNVIDALVVLLVLAIGVAGIAVVTMGAPGPGDTESATETETQHVTLEADSQPDYVVERLEPGTEGTVAGDQNATVTDVQTIQSETLLRLEIEGEPVEDLDTINVGDEPVQFNRDLTVDFGLYAVNGSVSELGTEPTLNMERTSATVSLSLTEVDPTLGDALEAGPTATEGGDTVVTVTDVEREPSLLVLESDDGELHEHEHPRYEDLQVALEVEALETDDGLYYQGQRLGVGQDLALEFETLAATGTITQVESE